MAGAANTQMFPKKTALTIALCAALFLVLPLIPGLRQFGGLRLRQVASLGTLPARTGTKPAETPATASPEEANTTSKTAEQAQGKQAVATAKAEASTNPEETNPYLFDPHGELDHFYEALERTARKEPGAVTLILHYGDSPVTADSITADARSILQAQFGDAGHGFLLITKPWAWYGHRGVELRGHRWKIQPATQARARDGLHGLGGVSFVGETGASSEVKLSTEQAHVEVEYLAKPGGGTFTVSAGDQKLGDVSTNREEKKAGFAEFDLPVGTREIALDVTAGPVRLFGYSFRRDEPGVIYSSLGLNGAQVQAVDRYFNAQHWTEQLQHQHPDLLIFNYGTNESVFPAYIEKQYPGELREVLQRIKTALPNTSLLVMSPMDRGQRDANGQIVTPPVLPEIVGIQKQTGLEMGCAFFDTYDAMGGAGTMGRWYNSEPRLVSADFMHPLPAGAAKVGRLLADALMKSFEGYEAQHKTLSAERQPAGGAGKRKP